jgi:hypothetical protein
MKAKFHIYFKLIVLLTLLICYPAKGQPVSDKNLTEVANTFIAENFQGEYRIIHSIEPYPFNNLKTLNLIELEPEGWILLSSDFRVSPVIGFSYTGKFIKPAEKSHDPMFLWLNMYQRQIKRIIEDSSLSRHIGWEKEKTSAKSKGEVADIVRVKPFMTVSWGQGKGWNQFCPADIAGPDGHVYVGCVAVSMAQAMSVFKIPVKGQGYKNYADPKYGTQYVNFANTTYYWDLMSANEADQYNSLLLYHCAVAVNMKFGADGSGTQTSYAASALGSYFSFSQNAIHKNRSGTDKEWQDILNAELKKGRPIIYSGDADDGNPGHAFNIDGVNNNYYHINWGWSGSNNGYFTLDALNPASNNFNKNQSAVIGIHPFYYPTDITLSDTLVREYQQPGTVIGRVSVIDEASDNKYTLNLICDSTFLGNKWVRSYFLDGDTLKTGRVFTLSDARIDTISVLVKDQFNNSLSKELILKIGESPTGISSNKEESRDNFYLYPNPASEILYIYEKSQMDILTIRIYSASGILIQRISNPASGAGIQLNTLKQGFYILEAEFENHRLTRRTFIRR